MPPAPGTRPSDTSGRAITVDGSARTSAANAGSSMPEPKHAPWRWTVTRSATAAMARPALCCRRTRWAVAGSGKDPNSSRSPPAQNEGPAPRRWTRRIEGSARTSRKASTSASRMARFRALRTSGRVRTTCSSSPSRRTATGGPSSARALAGRPRPPGGELGAGLEGGVRRRLGDEPVVDRPGLRPAEQGGERRRGDRLLRHGRDDRVDGLISDPEREVAHVGGGVAFGLGLCGEAEDDDGPPGVQGGERFGAVVGIEIDRQDAIGARLCPRSLARLAAQRREPRSERHLVERHPRSLSRCGRRRHLRTEVVGGVGRDGAHRPA